MTSPAATPSTTLKTSGSLPAVFRRLAGANLGAQAAEQISLAAVPLVAVLTLQAGPGEIGLLAGVQSLPFLLLALPLGLLADRFSRRRIMQVAEALRALSLLGLVTCAASDRLSLSLLGVLGFLGAAGTVAFSVAAPTLVPALVPRAQLAQANGRLELARSLAFAAGPALAGALVAAAGAAAAFVLATVLSGAALLLLMRLPEPARNAPLARRHPVAELKAGAAMVWQHPLLRPIVLTAVVWNMAWFVLQAAYVSHAVRHLGLSASAVGQTLAACGLGMVVGALAAPALMRRLPVGQAVVLGPLMSVLAMWLLVLTLRWPSGWLAAAGFFLFGVGPIIWTISSTTLRQAVTPAALLGRVTALFLTVNMGARPLGAALGAAVGAWAGEAACLWLALAGFVLQAALIWSSAVPTMTALPASAEG